MYLAQSWAWAGPVKPAGQALQIPSRLTNRQPRSSFSTLHMKLFNVNNDEYYVSTLKIFVKVFFIGKLCETKITLPSESERWEQHCDTDQLEWSRVWLDTISVHVLRQTTARVTTHVTPDDGRRIDDNTVSSHGHICHYLLDNINWPIRWSTVTSSWLCHKSNPRTTSLTSTDYDIQHCSILSHIIIIIIRQYYCSTCHNNSDILNCQPLQLACSSWIPSPMSRAPASYVGPPSPCLSHTNHIHITRYLEQLHSNNSTGPTIWTSNQWITKSTSVDHNRRRRECGPTIR